MTLKRKFFILMLTVVLAFGGVMTCVAGTTNASEVMPLADYGTPVVVNYTDRIAMSTYDTDGYVFGRNLLTVSGNATPVAGGTGAIQVILQKKGVFGYSNVATAYLTADGNSHNLFSAYSISSNATYRLRYVATDANPSMYHITFSMIPWNY